ncbi:MAG: hypothetical protein HQM10_12705 [Candidatus Riflebacteria bacterium]|nr:hypothetical protein [Candidatus Riflebacteria bacterium]
MKKIVLSLFVLCSMTFSGLFAAGPLSLESKIAEEYYPEPVEKLINKMIVYEDMLVGLHREYCRNLFKATSQKNYLYEQISVAIKDHLNLLSALLKKKYSDEKDFSKIEKRIRKYFESDILPGDKAAFTRFFEIFPANLRQGIDDLASTARNEEKSLADPKTLENYVAKCAADPKFYKRIPFASLFNGICDKWENLINRVKEKVAIEDMIRFLDRAKEKAPGDFLKKTCSEIQTRLVQKLIAEIEFEFSGLIEDKLCKESITLIARQENNSLIIKKSLLKGKLRTFIKKIGKLECLKDKPLFMSILNSVSGKIGAFSRKTKDPEALKYISMVADTLEMNKLAGFRHLKEQDDTQPLLKLFKEIGNHFADEDIEKCLPDIDKIF